MNLKEIKQALQAHFTVNPTGAVFLWGQPGCGKTEFTDQFAKDQGRINLDTRVSSMDQVDVRGLPSPKGDQVTWLVPEFLAQLTDNHNLFLDEFNAGQLSTLHSFYGVIQERRLGNWIAPEGLRIIAAGNRETDGCKVQKLPAALSDRFLHLDVDFDVEVWSEWAITHGVNPKAIAAARFQSEIISNFDPNARTSPTPRSFVRAARYLDVPDIPKHLRDELITGQIGQGAADALAAFVDQRLSIDLQDVIKRPNEAQIYYDLDVRWAITGSLAEVCKRMGDEAAAVFEPVVTYLRRWDEPEYLSLFVKHAETVAPAVTQTAAYQDALIDLGSIEN